MPKDSRVKLAMAKQAYSTETLLQAAILDGLNILIWQRTKSGAKGRNKPQSITDRLSHPEKYKAEHEKVMAFRSGEEFDRMFNSIIGKRVR